MTLTVKLDEQLNRALREYALAKGETASWVVREALAEYLVKVQAPKKSAYELGQGLFGAGDGPPDLAARRKEVVREIWGERQQRREAVAPPAKRRKA